MLADAPLVAFVAASDLQRARAFYEGILGLRVVGEDGFACEVDAHGTTLRIVLVDEPAHAPYAVLGWEVDDLDAQIEALTARGVAFSQFEGLEQDERGVWTAPGGARVAWFPDPDGHVLSLTQR